MQIAFLRSGMNILPHSTWNQFFFLKTHNKKTIATTSPSPAYYFSTKMRNDPNQNTGVLSLMHTCIQYNKRKLFTPISQLKNIRTVVVLLPNLLYFVTNIKTSHQFCNLLPSSTPLLPTWPPSYTKYALFTFYFPSAYWNPHLLTFSHFFNPLLISIPSYAGIYCKYDKWYKDHKDP